LAEWAEHTKQSRYTLYSRKRRCLSDPEVIYGPRSSPVSHSAVPVSIWPKGCEVQWESGYRLHAWTLTNGRRELRAAFLLRICKKKYQELMNTVEGIVPPGEEAGPEHDELFRNVYGWQRELRRAAGLLAQPNYREP
jgi:hypothetical protein